MSCGQKTGVCALFALLALVVWGKVAGFEFVWDDAFFIVFNPALRHWSSVPAYFHDVTTMAGGGEPLLRLLFRPLRNLSWLIDFKLAGLQPAWWHVHNLILHVVNALLVTAVARRLLPPHSFAALVAGLVFLLHPVQTETVAWVKCRDDLLSTGLVLLVFLLWLRWRSQLRPARIAVLALLTLAALLAKEQAVVLPLLLLALEGWLRRRSRTERGCRDAATVPAPLPWRRLVPALAAVSTATGGFLVWRHLAIGRTSQCGYLDGTLAATLVSMSKAGVEYLRLLLYPVRQLTDYAGFVPVRWNSAEFALCIGILAAVTVTVVAVHRRLPVVVWGGVWVVICLLPVANIIPMMQYMAERFLYLPMAGFAWLGAAVVAWGVERRPAVRWAAGLVLAWLAAMTFFRLDVWRNEIAVFHSVVQETPDTVLRPRRHLLNAWLEAGKYDEEALALARQVWETSRGLSAGIPKDRREDKRRYALLLLKTGQEETGVSMMEQLLRDEPDYPLPAFDLGIWEGRRGNYEAALAWFDRARQRGDVMPTTLYNRGVALEKLGRQQEAVESYRAAVAAGAAVPELFRHWRRALLALGRTGEAVEVEHLARRYWPGTAMTPGGGTPPIRAAPGAD